MTYKSIRAAAHNFVHSFMSYDNQIDGTPVAEVLYGLARERHGETIAIDWLQASAAETSLMSPDLRAAVEAHRATLTDFLRRHGVAREVLTEFRTEIFSDASRQMQVRACAVDDRGKTYNIPLRI